MPHEATTTIQPSRPGTGRRGGDEVVGSIADELRTASHWAERDFTQRFSGELTTRPILGIWLEGCISTGS
jgi:hypothetical protein